MIFKLLGPVRYIQLESGNITVGEKGGHARMAAEASARRSCGYASRSNKLSRGWPAGKWGDYYVRRSILTSPPPNERRGRKQGRLHESIQLN
uniref:Uncharacterized protein n=1 Tax=Oryza sativa subsp. japonica TaxID=39947 RepID=Q651I9_ORYSJ|nr:hypothetical protein [Oryza sativa Japonica Group]